MQKLLQQIVLADSRQTQLKRYWLNVRLFDIAKMRFSRFQLDWASTGVAVVSLSVLRNIFFGRLVRGKFIYEFRSFLG